MSRRIAAQSYGGGRVAYAGDAFDGLALMEKIVTGNFDDHLAERVKLRRAGRPVNEKRKLGRAADPKPLRPVDVEEIRAAPRRAASRPAACRSRLSGARESSARCR